MPQGGCQAAHLATGCDWRVTGAEAVAPCRSLLARLAREGKGQFDQPARKPTRGGDCKGQGPPEHLQNWWMVKSAETKLQRAVGITKWVFVEQPDRASAALLLAPFPEWIRGSDLLLLDGTQFMPAGYLLRPALAGPVSMQ